MSVFLNGEDRGQATLLPERLDDYVAEDNPVRMIDVFIDDLDISGLGFNAEPAATSRPCYHPKTMLKLHVYGILNRLQLFSMRYCGNCFWIERSRMEQCGIEAFCAVGECLG